MSDADTEQTFRATEVREMLDRLGDEVITETENVPEAVEQFAERVVEDGTYTPDCNVTASVSLPLRERLLGTREQDMTAMLILGMMLGSALERDVPKGSDREEAWEWGAFELPDDVDGDAE